VYVYLFSFRVFESMGILCFLAINFMRVICAQYVYLHVSTYVRMYICCVYFDLMHVSCMFGFLEFWFSWASSLPSFCVCTYDVCVF
jgi:hypothetical protein